jgi:diaminopimelate decarboxylase
MAGVTPRSRGGAVAVRPGSAEARELVARFGSPLYVYDAAEIENGYRRFVQAFPYRPLEVHYAIVCNKNPFIVRRLHRLGAGIHANTPGDAYAALAAGVPAERIVYSGSNLTARDLAFLLEQRIALNLDSADQLRDYARLRRGGSVGLRLLVDAPEKRNRIGVDLSELADALDLAAAAGARIVGLHMYVGTNTRRPSRFLECLDRLIGASELLADLEYVDVGGGYGIGYGENEGDLDLEAVGHGVSQRMEALSAHRGRRIRLLLEPGRALVGTSGSLLVAVVSVKHRGGRRFIGVDSTVGNIVVPSVYHAHHRIEAVEAGGRPLDVPTDVCGNTTHSRDFLARDVFLPLLVQGDLLVLRDVGAYGYAMSSHFLNRPRPAEVVLDGDEAVLTTRRETLDDLVALYGSATAR